MSYEEALKVIQQHNEKERQKEIEEFCDKDLIDCEIDNNKVFNNIKEEFTGLTYGKVYYNKVLENYMENGRLKKREKKI